MRIALCLSGQPRGLLGGCQMIKEYLISPSNIADIFVHTWYHPSLDGTPFNSSQPGNDQQLGRWMPNSDQYLREQLNPITLVAENQETIPNITQLQDVPGRATQSALASMFLSCYKANQLKSEYENANNFKYDLVVRTRIDQRYYKPINLKELVDERITDSIFVPATHQHMRDYDYRTDNSGKQYASMSETFSMSSSENMDKLCALGINFEYVYNQITPDSYAENYIGYWIRGHYQMPVISIDAPYDIYRGE